MVSHPPNCEHSPLRLIPQLDINLHNVVIAQDVWIFAAMIQRCPGLEYVRVIKNQEGRSPPTHDQRGLVDHVLGCFERNSLEHFYATWSKSVQRGLVQKDRKQPQICLVESWEG